MEKSRKETRTAMLFTIVLLFLIVVVFFAIGFFAGRALI
jgi:predicted nucleic acid-binding Zn ribbon protein